MPRATVVITFHQQPADLRRCLHALAREGLDDVEVVLVNNGSRDPRTPALLEAWADRATVLRNPVDAGRVAARNQGARAARSPVVVWVNPRAEVRPGWLAPLASAAAAPGAGVAGAVLLGADGRVRHAGMAMVGRGRVVNLHRGVPGDHPVVRSRPLRLVSGALMAVARDVLLDVGALDLTFAGGVAEADLCMRMWDAGRENALAAGSVAVLHGEDPVPEPGDEKAFRRRWNAAPPDRDGLLAEDGVADPGWADCVWEGPLLDDSPEAAEGRDALRALAAAGRRPMAREPEGTPLAPDAAGWCDEAILTALNRHRVGAPGSETFRRAPVPGSALRPAGREGIGWLGALLGRSGYAAAARGVVRAAHRAGLPVLALVTDASADGMAPPELALPPQDFAPGLIVIHGLPVMPSGIPFWDEATADLGLPVVGATCFETELMPPSWVEPCNRTREVWVPSGFNARTFADAGVDPERIHVVPYPVDTDRLRPAGRERDPGAPVTFLSIFEWTWRKGWDVLLQAWAEEFASGDPVRLVVVTYRGAGAAGRARWSSRRSRTSRSSAPAPTTSPTSSWCWTPSRTTPCPGSTRRPTPSCCPPAARAPGCRCWRPPPAASP